MNKRKILSLAMALSIVAIMAVGATLAYFTDTDKATNAFTIGDIDITLVEDFDDETNMVPSVGKDGQPGENLIKKSVTVRNDGDTEAYVRVLFAAEDTRDVASAIFFNSPYHTGSSVRTGEDVWVTPKVDGQNDWLQIKDADGTVYTVHYVTLSQALAADATTGEILKSVGLETTADNAWTKIVGESWDLKVLVQGCQVITNSATADIDDSFGFDMSATADNAVAELFAEAFGGTWTAHTYTDENAWVEGNGLN